MRSSTTVLTGAAKVNFGARKTSGARFGVRKRSGVFVAVWLPLAKKHMAVRSCAANDVIWLDTVKS
jgi:hypothetical protein